MYIMYYGYTSIVYIFTCLLWMYFNDFGFDYYNLLSSMQGSRRTWTFLQSCCLRSKFHLKFIKKRGSFLVHSRKNIEHVRKLRMQSSFLRDFTNDNYKNIEEPKKQLVYMADCHNRIGKAFQAIIPL